MIRMQPHMRARLAPMLYADGDKAATEAVRESPRRRGAAPPAAPAQNRHRPIADSAPVPSFPKLLADLATLARNAVVVSAPNRPFTILICPIPI